MLSAAFCCWTLFSFQPFFCIIFLLYLLFCFVFFFSDIPFLLLYISTYILPVSSARITYRKQVLCYFHTFMLYILCAILLSRIEFCKKDPFFNLAFFLLCGTETYKPAAANCCIIIMLAAWLGLYVSVFVLFGWSDTCTKKIYKTT